MKKPLIILTLMLLTTSVIVAQEFKPFKVGIGFGYAVPSGGEGGALIYLEPGYRASDIVLIGLRLESALISRGLEGTNRNISGDATSNASYTLNGQYYFNDHYVRPFLGAGFGLFTLAAIEYTAAAGPEINRGDIETRLGFYPRVGLDIGHFNLTLDYNIIPRTNHAGTGEIKNSYAGIRAGFTIGGGSGRKNNID